MTPSSPEDPDGARWFRTTFHVPKMDCPSEERMIGLALTDVDGVDTLKFDIPDRFLVVVHSVPVEELDRRLAPLGLGARLMDSTQLATRPEFMAAGWGPSSSSFPDFLVNEKEELDSHMELWLRLSPGQAAMLEMVGELGVTNDLMLEFLSTSESSDLVEEAKLERHGEWSVIKLGKVKEN